MLFFKKKNKKYRILAIDGGGIKGVFTAYAIKKLEEDYNIKLLDHFDLVAGTSTGALIAAGLLENLPGNEIYEEYVSDDNNIFAKRNSLPQQLRSTFLAKYNKDELEKELIKNFGDRLIGEFYENSKKSFLIFGSNFTKAEPIVYASPDFEEKGYVVNESSIFEALRTSTAAPMYFEPYQMNNSKELLMDGGVWANNPAQTAINMVMAEKGYNPSNIEVLSFGQTYTEELNFQLVKGRELLKDPTKNSIVMLLMSSLAANQNNQTWSSKILLKDNLFRYCPDKHQKGVSLDVSSPKFINYSKVYWEKHEKELVKFILRRKK